VHAAYAALEAGNVQLLGELLLASHESLRTDYEVSCREVDILVEIARAAPGVAGARMIGGGFGGCILALVDAGHVDDLREHLRVNYQQATSMEPATYVCEFGRVGGMIA
jgi:galactokinase